jgi:hypothetical protein
MDQEIKEMPNKQHPQRAGRVLRECKVGQSVREREDEENGQEGGYGRYIEMEGFQKLFNGGACVCHFFDRDGF